MLCKHGSWRHAVSVHVCLFVRLSVTFVDSVKTNARIFKSFSPSSSQAILAFPYQTAWQYSDGNPPPPTQCKNYTTLASIQLQIGCQGVMYFVAQITRTKLRIAFSSICGNNARKIANADRRTILPSVTRIAFEEVIIYHFWRKFKIAYITARIQHVVT